MSKFYIGIEWNTSHANIAVFKKARKNIHLQSVERISTVFKTTDEIIRLLKLWKKDTLPKNAEVQTVLNIPESLIFLKEITLPRIKRSQLSEAVYWDVLSRSGNLPSESILQWKEINDKSDKTRVSAMVIKNDVSEKYISLFKQVGLPLSAIEPSSLSLSRIINRNDKNNILVNLQNSETNIIVLERGVPVFSSSFSITLSQSDSEKRKLSKEDTEIITASIQRVVSYWKAQNIDAIKNIVLTGESVYYPSLAKSIEKISDINVDIESYDRLKIVSIGKVKKLKVLEYRSALGAAQRLFTPGHYTEVNLFPESMMKGILMERQRIERQRKMSVFITLNIFILIALIALLGALRVVNIARVKDIAQTKQFVENHPSQVNVKKTQAANTLLSKVTTLMNSQEDAGERLKQISSLTPTRVQLTSIQMSNNPDEEWEISGIADRNDVLAFFDKLGDEAGAQEVTMPYSSLQTEVDGIFRITLLW